MSEIDSTDLLVVHSQLSRGGEWLGASRRWLQNNVQGGDSICWSDAKPVSIPFCKMEDFALKVATAAVLEDRLKREKENKRAAVYVQKEQ
jgi:hypothetical protein